MLKIVTNYIVIVLILTSSILFAKNLGHRLGGDIYGYEDTLYCYKKALKYLQNKKSFKYAELDIRESKDGHIVVFHDSKIKRVIPNNRFNKYILKDILKYKKFNKIKISDLTLNEIQSLRIADGVKIPTLEDILDYSIVGGLKKPIKIEIKKLNSDKARYRLVELIKAYKNRLNISIIAFKKNFKKSFDNPNYWLKKFNNNGIKVYRIMKDRKYIKYKSIKKYNTKKYRYSIIIPKKRFNINSNQKRVMKYSINHIINNCSNLLVGIYGGKDDSGDKGIYVKIEDNKDNIIFNGFSNKRTWKLFEINILGKSIKSLILEDLDTKLSGKYPGNSGYIKVKCTNNDQ